MSNVIVFMSQYSDLCLALPPDRCGMRPDPTGGIERDHMNRIVTDSETGKPMLKQVPWPNVDFKRGRFETADSKLIALLRQHRGNRDRVLIEADGTVRPHPEGGVGEFFELTPAAQSAGDGSPLRKVIEVPPTGFTLVDEQGLNAMFKFASSSVVLLERNRGAARAEFERLLALLRITWIEAVPANRPVRFLHTKIKQLCDELEEAGIWHGPEAEAEPDAPLAKPPLPGATPDPLDPSQARL